MIASLFSWGGEKSSYIQQSGYQQLGCITANICSDMRKNWLEGLTALSFQISNIFNKIFLQHNINNYEAYWALIWKFFIS